MRQKIRETIIEGAVRTLKNKEHMHDWVLAKFPDDFTAGEGDGDRRQLIDDESKRLIDILEKARAGVTS
jgi:hypothetical protein